MHGHAVSEPARQTGAVAILLGAIACAPEIAMLPSASHPFANDSKADLTLPVPVLRVPGHTSEVQEVAFSPDGRLLYSAGYDKVVKIWDVASGEEIGVIYIPHWTGTDGAIYALDVSPDGRFLAIGGCQGCSRQWPEGDAYLVYVVDLETLEIVGSGSADASVHALAFSPDGERLATGGADGRLRIFLVGRDGRLVEEAALPGHGATIADLSWQLDPPAVYTASFDGLVVAWRPHRAGGWFADWKLEHGFRLSALDVVPGGDRLVVAGRDGSVRLVDARQGSEIAVLMQLRSAHVMTLAVSADGESVAYGSGAGTWEETGLGILSIPDGAVEFFHGARESVFHLAWHQEERSLVALTEGHFGSISVVEAGGGEIRRLGVDTWPLGAVSSDGVSIIWKRWNEPDFRGHAFQTDELRLVAHESVDRYRSHGDNRIFSLMANVPSDGYVSLTRRPQSTTWKIPVLSTRILAWTVLDDDWAALGGEHEMVLLNLRGRGERRLRCYGHSSLINGVSVHGVRGEIVVSASSDRTIRFWNRRSCELLLTLFPFDDAQWVAWTPSGLFAASETGASLLEFQINRGAHRSPQVVPSARFPSLQRPDLIRRILQQGTATGIAVTPSPSELAEASR